MNDQALRELESIDLLTQEIREQALTMRGCTIVGQFEYHANRFDKIADKIEKHADKIEQFITGAGTGKG